MKYKLLSLIIILVLLTIGANGCEEEVKKTGLEFSLVSGIDMLSGGKTIEQGESFHVQHPAFL